MTNVLNTLNERDFVEQLTHEEEINKLFSNEKVSFYIGFDPTADSLHVGHFVSLMVASHMQKAGHRPIILIGGGTATIGDPSGKSDMRRMMSNEEINHNVEKFKVQISKFLSFEGKNATIIVNNADWLSKLNYIDFMREIGVEFSINKMLAAECYKQRLEQGLTFFELGYMLMQAYDFYYLNKNYNCKLQLGGNDQWSNIIAGVELIRKLNSSEAFGLTFKLLTTKEGKKMGKTEKGALWLDANKTSPYEFYQYWRNVADDDVKTVLSLLTFLPMDEVNRLSNLKDKEINEAKKTAAFEITKLVHGEEEATKAQTAAEALFESGVANADNMPCTKIDNANITLADAIVLSGIAPSKSQARTLIMQNGISLNDNIISDIAYVLKQEDFTNNCAILKKGKKIYHKLELN